MRSTLRFIAALSVAVIPGAATAQAAAVAKTIITPAGQTANPNLSAGVRVGDMLYASGQLGMARPTADTTIEGQTKLALENVKTVMEAGGTSMANVVKCTVFLTRFADFQGMNRTYREYFPKDPPARSTVIVAALVSAGALVEIECMAVVPK
jgi:2-iminobutanoate/2-iminopropanoate deaminase